MRKVWVALVIAGLMAVCSAPVSAGVVFDNGGPNNSSFEYSYNIPGQYDQAYDQFTLSFDTTITAMEWWGVYSEADPSDTFYYTIATIPDGSSSYTVTASGLLSGLLETNTHTIFSLAGIPEPVYDYNASAKYPIPLVAGTYFLSIYDNVFGWCWLDSSQTETFWSDENSVWSGPGSVGLAFNLTGVPGLVVGAAVPEPISMIFFGTGLVAVGGFMARRRMLRNA